MMEPLACSNQPLSLSGKELPDYSLQNLDKAADKAGINLFGPSVMNTSRRLPWLPPGTGIPEGYITRPSENIVHQKLSDRIAEDEDAQVDDFEHVFFPSTKYFSLAAGTGLDVSGDHWKKARPEWVDKDGNIYTKQDGTIYVTHVDIPLRSEGDGDEDDD